MARNLTSGYVTAVTDQVVRPLVLVVAEFDSETLRFFNGVGTLTYDGNTYTGAANLLNISQIVETQKVEARGIEISLNGISSALVSVAASEPYQGRRITVSLCALDASGNIISDPFVYFSGKADVLSIDIGAETSTLIMTAESDLINLQRVNERRRTKGDQQKTYPDDTFFDKVVSLQDASITWGKDVT